MRHVCGKPQSEGRNAHNPNGLNHTGVIAATVVKSRPVVKSRSISTGAVSKLVIPDMDIGLAPIFRFVLNKPRTSGEASQADRARRVGAIELACFAEQTQRWFHERIQTESSGTAEALGFAATSDSIRARLSARLRDSRRSASAGRGRAGSRRSHVQLATAGRASTASSRRLLGGVGVRLRPGIAARRREVSQSAATSRRYATDGAGTL